MYSIWDTLRCTLTKIYEDDDEWSFVRNQYFKVIYCHWGRPVEI